MTMPLAQQQLIQDARGSLAAARLLLDGGYPGYAASRAYYAMFYAAQALLEGEQLSFSKHSAVIAAFGQRFAHAGRVPTEFHRFLITAQELRHSGDYSHEDVVTLDQAREQLDHAERFITLAEQLLGATTTPFAEDSDSNDV